jgi:hypothetical protein
VIENSVERETAAPMKKYNPQHIVALLRQAEV